MINPNLKEIVYTTLRHRQGYQFDTYGVVLEDHLFDAVYEDVQRVISSYRSKDISIGKQIDIIELTVHNWEANLHRHSLAYAQEYGM